ncbi:MAG: hypothetical protein AAB373_04790 [Patescibacteria group bacterium]
MARENVELVDGIEARIIHPNFPDPEVPQFGLEATITCEQFRVILDLRNRVRVAQVVDQFRSVELLGHGEPTNEDIRRAALYPVNPHLSNRFSTLVMHKDGRSQVWLNDGDRESSSIVTTDTFGDAIADEQGRIAEEIVRSKRQEYFTRDSSSTHFVADNYHLFTPEDCLRINHVADPYIARRQVHEINWPAKKAGFFKAALISGLGKHARYAKVLGAVTETNTLLTQFLS